MRICGDRVLPRPSSPQRVLHLRPDEHVLQALPRGLAALRGRRRPCWSSAPRARRGHLRRGGRAAASGLRPALARARLFTAATAVRGGIVAPNRPSPPAGASPAGRTLDGLAYLETLAPRRVPRRGLAAQRTCAGTPVVLEAQGPSYQEFSRDLDAHGTPDRARLGVPRPAARQPRAEIAARRERRPADLLEPERRGRSRRSCAATTSATCTSAGSRRRPTRAAGLQKFDSATGALPASPTRTPTRRSTASSAATRRTSSPRASPLARLRDGRGARRTATSPRSSPRSWRSRPRARRPTPE